MSLMVHPAPLIRNEPSANLVQRIVKEMSSGVVVATAAVVVVVVATVAAVADAAVEVEEVAVAAAERSGVYAKAVDHRQGWSSSIVPMGLSSRANRAYG